MDAYMQKLPWQVLVGLMPHEPDSEVRRAVASEVDRHPRRANETWADAWNRVTGADPRQPGTMRVWLTRRCPRCSGRRIDMRLGRVCFDCQGRGRTHQDVVVACRHAKVQ